MSDYERINEIWVRFRAALAEAFQAAYAVEAPAGDDPAWAAVRGRYGVAAIPEAERAEVRAAQHPLRGAAAMELRDVVDALCRSTRRETKQIKVDWEDGAAERQQTALLSLIERTERELLTAYRNAVLPKRAGMFGNVFATGAPAAAPRAPAASTISCRGCGAPRLSDRDFQCAYCGQKMI